MSFTGVLLVIVLTTAGEMVRVDPSESNAAVTLMFTQNRLDAACDWFRPVTVVEKGIFLSFSVLATL